jgi:ADP-heptose:LPS heptosyltransferase
MKLWPAAEQRLFLANMAWSRLLNALRGKPKQIRSILCVKLDEIGDMATALHVFGHLRRQFPEAEITLLCKPFNREWMQACKDIDRIITDPDEWQQAYDLVVEMRGNWKTFWKSFRFLPRYRLDRGTVRFRQRGAQPHELITNFRIIEPLMPAGTEAGRAVLQADRQAAKAIAEWLESQQIGKYCVLHTGARRKLRQWPPERFARLAAFLHARYGLTAVLAGSADEHPAIESLAAQIESPHSILPSGFGLPHLVALLARASLFVGNESGPLHLACALDIPVVGIYGPGVKDVFYPWSERSAYVHHVLDCNPCDQVHCVFPEHPCIVRATEAEVQEAVAKVMDQAGLEGKQIGGR